MVKVCLPLPTWASVASIVTQMKSLKPLTAGGKVVQFCYGTTHTVFNICAMLHRSLSRLLFVASATCCAGLASEGFAEQKLPSIAFESGSVYEVREVGTAKPVIKLYRFHQNGKFDVVYAGGVYLLNVAQWKRDGSTFRITAKTNEQWFAEGQFTEKGIEGVVDDQKFKRKFAGTRVDYESYELPLEEGEVIVLLLMKRCHSWPFPTELELADDGARKDEPLEVDRIYGFEFEALAPRELKGMLVTAHHDGEIWPGPAVAIAKPGKTYLWRTQRMKIGGRKFDICSFELEWMKESDDLGADPRYLSGMALLQTLKQTPNHVKMRTESGGSVDRSQPIRSETNSTNSAVGSRR